MKRKTILFLCSSLMLIGLLNKPTSTLSINAATIDVEYTNNAYQVCKYQDNVTNYFLSDSMYSATGRICLLKNSIRLRKPKSNKLTLVLEFNNAIGSFLEGGYLRYYIVDNEGKTLEYIDLEVTDERDLEFANDKFELYCNCNTLMITLDCSSLPDTFILAGNEYLGEDKSLLIDLSNSVIEDTHIKKFMLFDGSSSKYIYSAPELGKYAGYDELYYNGDSFYLEINYDNRLTINQILEYIVAYDYGDNKELTKTVTNDNYSQAIKDNSLGLYSVNVSAVDSQNHKSVITLQLDIKDKTNPVINGPDEIVVSYTKLGTNGSIDLSQYFTASDNYDGEISITGSTYNLKSIKDYELYAYAKDSSNNVGSKLIKVSIVDDIDPTIEGPDEIDLYQFEVSDPKVLLEEYTFDDGKGTGVIETGFLDSFPMEDLKKVGSTTHTIYCKDLAGNIAKKEVVINVKDGVGPVFFINAKSISVTTSSKMSSDNIKELLITNGNIKDKQYVSTSFMDNNYVDNYNVPGTYETKIACYQEDGAKDFYKVTIEVTKAKEKNVFKSLLESIFEFFSKFGSFFKYIWNLFLSGF